nr:hypothetical protein [Tanacetum cinerariifolium]
MSLLQEALDACAAFARRVEHLEYDKVAQALEITKLERRVKKLERGNKAKVLKIRRLKKVGTSQRIVSSDDTNIEDASNQVRMIDELDRDEGVALMDDEGAEEKAEEAQVPGDDQVKGRQAEIYKIDIDHALKVLSMQEDEPEVQEVVDVVTTAKLITEVVTAAKYARKLHEELNKDIDWNAAIDHVKQKAKEDPYVQRYQVMKKKPQTEAQARRNMITYLKSVAGFILDYFKGMSYDDIRPIFEAKFNSNIKFLIKSKEQIEEEENRSIQSINEIPAQKAAKRRNFGVDAAMDHEENTKCLMLLIRPMLYDGSFIAKETNMISIANSKETLMLEEESRSKMILKQSDPKVLEKKVTSAGTRVKTASESYYCQYKEVTAAQVEVIQELLGYARDTFPDIHKPSEKLVVVTPINKKKLGVRIKSLHKVTAVKVRVTAAKQNLVLLDATALLQAIEKRFGGNAATKKTQRNLLKQQYENFTASSSEMLDQTCDRLQKLISQLEIHGEIISQKDVNQKFLRSRSPEWNTHTIVWRNKPEIDTLSLDDLDNKLKIYKPEKPIVETSEAKASADKPKVIRKNFGPPLIED